MGVTKEDLGLDEFDFGFENDIKGDGDDKSKDDSLETKTEEESAKKEAKPVEEKPAKKVDAKTAVKDSTKEKPAIKTEAKPATKVDDEPQWAKDLRSQNEELRTRLNVYESAAVNKQDDKPKVNPIDEMIKRFNPSKDDINDLLSGEPDKAINVLRNVLRSALEMSHEYITQDVEDRNAQREYDRRCTAVFVKRFPVLEKYPEDVTIVENAVKNLPQFKGKKTHELIDVIGNTTIVYLQKKGVAFNQQQTTTTKGEEEEIETTEETQEEEAKIPTRTVKVKMGDSVRGSRSNSKNGALTPLEKEMFDLI